MARSVKAAQYERTSRLRRTYDVQANMLGWSKLDTLAAYLTDDDQLIVFDKDERRLTGDALPLPAELENVREPVLVEPADIAVGELGTRWEAARGAFGAKLSELDLTTIDRGKALASFEKAASTLLRAVEILRETSGPDWRERIGL